MSRRGRRSVFGGLGNSMRPDRRRRKKDRLLAVSGFGRKKRGKESGLAGGLGLGDRMFKRRRGGMTSEVAQSLRDRLSPTERAEIREQVDRAIDADPQLRGDKSDADLTGNESFIHRLVRIVRNRLRG